MNSWHHESRRIASLRFFVPRSSLFPISLMRTPLLLSGLFLSILFSMLSTPARQQNARSESKEITVQHGTLILLGISKTDITLAADTEHSSEAQGIRKGADKITQIGNESACTLNDVASLGNGFDKADFSNVIKRWATNHPPRRPHERHRLPCSKRLWTI
jgi:hypothetical protein